MPEPLQFGELVFEVPRVGYGLDALGRSYGQKFRQAPVKGAYLRPVLAPYDIDCQGHGDMPQASFAQDLAGHGGAGRSGFTADRHEAYALKIQLPVPALCSWVQFPAIAVGLVPKARVTMDVFESRETRLFSRLYSPEEGLKGQMQAFQCHLLGLGVQRGEAWADVAPLSQDPALVRERQAMSGFLVRANTFLERRVIQPLMQAQHLVQPLHLSGIGIEAIGHFAVWHIPIILGYHDCPKTRRFTTP